MSALGVSISIGIGIEATLGGVGGYFRSGTLWGTFSGAVGGAVAGGLGAWAMPAIIALCGTSTLRMVTTGAITGGITGFTERFVYGGMTGEDIYSNLWDSGFEGAIGIFLGGGFSAIGKIAGVASKLFNEFKGVKEYIATYLKRIGTSKYAQFLRNHADDIPQQMNHWDEMMEVGEDAWMKSHKPNIHPTGFQTSMGGKFVIPKNQEGTKFLYNMDENGLLSIVHSVLDTSHLKFGQFSRGAGEVSFHKIGNLDVVQINNVTSNYTNTNIDKILNAFKSLGYDIAVEHKGPMGATISPPTLSQSH
jgi:hypothetical protein